MAQNELAKVQFSAKAVRNIQSPFTFVRLRHGRGTLFGCVTLAKFRFLSVSRSALLTTYSRLLYNNFLRISHTSAPLPSFTSHTRRRSPPSSAANTRAHFLAHTLLVRTTEPNTEPPLHYRRHRLLLSYSIVPLVRVLNDSLLHRARRHFREQSKIII